MAAGGVTGGSGVNHQSEARGLGVEFSEAVKYWLGHISDETATAQTE